MMASPDAIAYTFACNVCAQYLCPRPSFEAQALKSIRCAKREQLLISINEEELLAAHGITGKNCRVCSHVLLPLASIHREMSPQAGKFTVSYLTLQELLDFFKMSEALEAIKKENWIQARWISTTLLTATSSDNHQPRVTKSCGLWPEEGPCHHPFWHWDCVWGQGLGIRLWPGIQRDGWPPGYHDGVHLTMSRGCGRW